MKPEYLYHYTNAVGLAGIAQGKMLWASGLRYMNDSLEDKYANYRAAKFIRKRAIKMNLDEQQRTGMNMVADKVEEGGGVQYTFAFSMSEEPDLLSQWRAYTPDGGYSVGFLSESIEEIASQNNFTLAKCVYDANECEKLIEDRVNQYLDPIQSWILSDEECQEIAHNISKVVFPLRPILKHESFAEEKEWRIYGYVSTNDVRCKWRASGPYVHPYVELPFQISESINGGRGPIDSIWISPGVDVSRAWDAAGHLMHGCGMKPQRYCRSASPFRR